MNWEGHDDWMIELPAAKILRPIGEKPRSPRPPAAKRRPCLRREQLGQMQPNPYETVLPLCPAGR
jgi:hypothetical protein